MVASRSAAQQAAGAKPRVRIAISSDVTGAVNENDAKASMVAWATTVTRGTSLEMERDGVWVVAPAEMAATVRKGQAEALGITVRDYRQVVPYLWNEQIVLDAGVLKDNSVYLLLVHEESGIRSLADMKGRSVVIWSNPRLLLAEEWLAVTLAGAKLGTPAQFLGRMTKTAKVSGGAVLPVFFKQADACLVGAGAFEGMCELNPQLRKKLRVIASSPALVATFLAFHKDFQPTVRSAFIQSVLGLHKSASGQQALTLFQGVRTEAVSVSVLKASLELLQTYDRLKGRAAGGGHE